MKKILFVIESLHIGGAEKSLVTLLNLLDYSELQVDLLLFSEDGEFKELLPKEVNVLPIPDYFGYCSVPWSSVFLKMKKPRFLLSQLLYSCVIRFGRYSNIHLAVLFWKCCHFCFHEMQKDYDFAIAYAHGVPTFFVADKITAKKKVAWVNAIYTPERRDIKYIGKKYDTIDLVNCVTDAVKEQLQQTFGFSEEKMCAIMDIVDETTILKMAEMPSEADNEMNCDVIKILTVGRYAHMKGYELAIEAAKILKDRGVKFKWFAVGEGNMRPQMELDIERFHLQNEFILLGSRANPYPYFRKCDIYVQPSTFEGFGITLAEAKVFNKPIVVTNFDAVRTQFENEKNGLIVDISSIAIAEGIEKMINNHELRNKCVDNLSKEQRGNRKELKKFIELIG